MRRTTLLLLGALVSSAAHQTSAQEPDTTWRVYLRRAGPVLFGMSVAQAASALHDPNAGSSSEVPDTCDVLGSNKIPEHVSFTIKNDTIMGVSVDNAALRLASGAGIGDSEDRIKALYPGHLQVKPHPRYPRGHYLVYVPTSPSDQQFTIIFETDGDHVLWFRVGFARAAESAWGCPAA